MAQKVTKPEIPDQTVRENKTSPKHWYTTLYLLRNSSTALIAGANASKCVSEINTQYTTYSILTTYFKNCVSNSTFSVQN